MFSSPQSQAAAAVALVGATYFLTRQMTRHTGTKPVIGDEPLNGPSKVQGTLRPNDEPAAKATKKPGPQLLSYTGVSKTVMLLAPLDEGLPSAELGVHFDIQEVPLDVKSLAVGEVLLKVLCMSADPYLRGRIKSHTTDGSAGPVPMTGFVACKVLASNNAKWVAGDLLGASLPFTTVQVADLTKTLAWDLTPHVDEANVSLGIGALGMPGSTAYGGLIDVLRPLKGETLCISGAAGAVGSLVGQIGKQVYGCKVIGICGGPAKVANLTERYGFDGAIDRKTLPAHESDGGWTTRTKELVVRLKTSAPDGIDMYFDNVGQEYFEAAYESLRPKGRIAICGQIAGYHAADAPKPRIYPGTMIYTFQRIEGFVCSPWLSGQRGNFLQDMSRWIKEGKIQTPETFFEGVAAWPVAFRSLFANTDLKEGKVVIRMADGDYGEDKIQFR